MVDPTHARLSIVRQCRLVSVARSSFYYEGTGESPLNLRLLRGIDAQFLETPFYGSRQMTRWLRRQGDTVSRKRVRRLMRRLGGARDLPTAQDVSGGPGAQGLSLPVTGSPAGCVFATTTARTTWLTISNRRSRSSGLRVPRASCESPKVMGSRSVSSVRERRISCGCGASKRSKTSAWPCSRSSGRTTNSGCWRNTTIGVPPRCDAISTGWTR